LSVHETWPLRERERFSPQNLGCFDVAPDDEDGVSNDPKVMEIKLGFLMFVRGERK